MSNTYQLGTSVKLSAAFANEDGVAFDPAAVTCEVQAPSQAAGVKTTYTYGADASLVKDSEGNYHLWIATDEVGDWVYGFTGSDEEDVSNDDIFTVETAFR